MTSKFFFAAKKLPWIPFNLLLSPKNPHQEKSCLSQPYGYNYECWVLDAKNNFKREESFTSEGPSPSNKLNKQHDLLKGSIKQRKPLPPIPQRQQPLPQFNNLQQRRDQFSLSSSRQEKSTTMQHQFYSSQQSHQSSSKTTSSSTIIQDISLFERVPLERVSDFASHMTCFLWFGDYMMDPHSSSSSIIVPPPGGNGHGRFADYKPRDAFKKFCRDVISATQVSHSVILLSLLYIHRMKINNPTIKGQNGSEYRTFTVALMLSNKFLDDNTYTNKTWSEVTNIPVSEINTMEMEFLSSLNYQLYVSEQQFFDWVRNMITFVSIGDDRRNNDDSAPDCSMNISQRSQYSQKQQQILVPVQSMSTGFKRSAEQAFVDGMMVSPPKRTNCYPTYQQPQLVVQPQPQQVYAQTFAYPTPPPSTSSSQQLAYYNLQTTGSSNNSGTSMFGQQPPPLPSSYELRQNYTLDPMNVFYATRRNFINARSASSAFPISNMSFTTTVV
ncbi:15949_t:CDS:2 [Acaulospora morrowiae]|uniref:15949_t:CDS:1 n=1 Tax=Acaulospora morrowiae TaxID=94023 RepID=A0A9N8YT26_9GLOM|nr:15949_t:CDS:2 [Acaulospora morrowiae]